MNAVAPQHQFQRILKVELAWLADTVEFFYYFWESTWTFVESVLCRWKYSVEYWITDSISIIMVITFIDDYQVRRGRQHFRTVCWNYINHKQKCLALYSSMLAVYSYISLVSTFYYTNCMVHTDYCNQCFVKIKLWWVNDNCKTDM